LPARVRSFHRDRCASAAAAAAAAAARRAKVHARTLPFPPNLSRPSVSSPTPVVVCLPRGLVGIIPRHGNYRYPEPRDATRTHVYNRRETRSRRRGCFSVLIRRATTTMTMTTMTTMTTTPRRRRRGWWSLTISTFDSRGPAISSSTSKRELSLPRAYHGCISRSYNSISVINSGRYVIVHLWPQRIFARVSRALRFLLVYPFNTCYRGWFRHLCYLRSTVLACSRLEITHAGRSLWRPAVKLPHLSVFFMIRITFSDSVQRLIDR